jgi:AcrR family transcriptional regulator
VTNGRKKKKVSARAPAKSASRVASSSMKASRPPAKRAARASYHHGDLRRAILLAARLELEENGPVQLSMREVARRAGVSHAAPNHHFSTKDDLLAALGAEGFRVFAAALRSAADAGGDDPFRRLQVMGVGYLRFARENPGLFGLLWGAMPMSRCEVWRAPSNEAFMVLVEEVARVRASLGLGGSPLGDAMLHWVIVHGIAKLWADMPTAGEIVDENELYRYVSERVMAVYAPGVVPPSPLVSPFSGGPPT